MKSIKKKDHILIKILSIFDYKYFPKVIFKKFLYYYFCFHVHTEFSILFSTPTNIVLLQELINYLNCMSVVFFSNQIKNWGSKFFTDYTRIEFI